MKVLLVDDHPLILTALQSIIQMLDSRVEVVTAETPHDLFSLLAVDASVNLVLLDLLLGPAVDGFLVLAQLRERYPALPVVVVSSVDRLTDMVRVVDMGAMGFVAKGLPTRELHEALAMVLAGGVFIPPALLGLDRPPGMNLADAAAQADAAASADAARQRVANSLANTASLASAANTASTANTASAAGAVQRAMPAASAAPPPALATGPASPDGHGLVGGSAVSTRASLATLGITPRQTDVLLLLLKGLPNKLIARELNVSVDTIKDHVAAVLRALGVVSRTQAVLVVGRLMQQGLAGGVGGGLAAGMPGAGLGR